MSLPELLKKRNIAGFFLNLKSYAQRHKKPGFPKELSQCRI